MASVVINGDTSGQITLSAPTVAGTNTITLPASTGTVLVEPSGADITVPNSTGTLALTSDIPPAGAFTLLGTITTTTGASQTLSGLVLTPYKFLYFTINGVSSSSTAGSFQLVDPSTTVLALATVSGTATNRIFGNMWISLQTGTLFYLSAVGVGAGTAVVGAGGSAAGVTTFTTSSTSITFSLSNGNFDAGSISVYGVQ